SYLTWFEKPIPALLKAWDNSSDNPLKARLAEQIALLRAWDLRWSAASVPTTLAIFWGDELRERAGADAKNAGLYLSDYICTKAPPQVLLQSLAAASDKL